MNKAEAWEILTQELADLRARSYEDLQKLIRSPQVLARDAESGVPYQIEIEAFWDNPKQPGEDLRVLATIDDGGFISAFRPLSSDFIITANGEFKGE